MKRKQIPIRKLSGFSTQKKRCSDSILSGKQQKENGFESNFFLTDTLEARKAEKQRLPIAGKKHILSNLIHHKDTWPSHQVIFSVLCQLSNI